VYPTEPTSPRPPAAAALQNFESSILEQRDSAQAAVGANADDRATTLRQGGKFLDRLAQDARAGGGERVSERNAAAAKGPSTPTKGVRMPAASQIVLSLGAMMQLYHASGTDAAIAQVKREKIDWVFRRTCLKPL